LQVRFLSYIPTHQFLEWFGIWKGSDHEAHEEHEGHRPPSQATFAALFFRLNSARGSSAEPRELFPQKMQFFVGFVPFVVDSP
jgi:hypothetical protein